MMPKKFFLIFLLFVFSVVTVSATAVFNNIPVWNVNVLQSAAINLNNYCYSNSSSYGCASNSYSVQFVDPDTSQIVYLFNGMSSSNSYFMLKMGSNGNLILQSQNKVITNIPITVYASDVPLTSQIKTVITLNINAYSAPLQVGSLKTLTVNGNSTVSFPISNLFMNYNTVNVVYSDPVLAQSISLTGSLTTQKCTASTSGAIYVCLVPSSSSILLQITGHNLNYFQPFYITASNNYGSTPFSNSVNVIVNSAGVNASIPPPFRNPLSVGAINIGFNDVGAMDLDLLWTNYTYISAVFSNPNNPSSNVTLQLGVINYTSYNTASFNSNYFSVYLNSLTYPDIHLQVNSNITNTSFPIYLTACNNGGCDSNNSVIGVNINGLPPVAAPVSVGGILMGYNQVKNYDLNTLFSGQSRLSIQFTDPNSIGGTDIYNWSDISLSSSSFDAGAISTADANISAVFHYTADITVNSGNLLINGNQINLSSGTYSGYSFNATTGTDTNFTATGVSTISNLRLWSDYFNATLMNTYDTLPSTASSYNTTGVFTVKIINSSATITVNGYIGTPAFYPVLYEHGILSITSGSQDVNITLYPLACNSAGCTNGNLLNGQFAIPLIITSNPFPEYSQINSSFWRGAASDFRGLFPDKKGISNEKGYYILIVIGLVLNLIILFLGTSFFSNGDNVRALLIICGIIDVILFILGIALNYIPAVIWITILGIAILAIIIKVLVGKNNG